MSSCPMLWLSPRRLGALLAFAAVGTSAPAAESSPPPPSQPKEEPVVVLTVHEVLTAPPKLSFGLSLEVWKDNHTGKILNLYVTKVRPGSSAADARITPRTRIDRIDGVPVEQLTASFLNGSDLNKFFVNRKLSDKVVLEILPEGHTQAKTVVLTEKPWFEFESRVHDVERGYELDRIR